MRGASRQRPDPAQLFAGLQQLMRLAEQEGKTCTLTTAITLYNSRSSLRVAKIEARERAAVKTLAAVSPDTRALIAQRWQKYLVAESGLCPAAANINAMAWICMSHIL